MTALLFYDYGDASLFHDPLPNTRNTRVIRAFGIGLNWVANNNIALRMSYGWRGDSPATSERGHDLAQRLYFSLIKDF